MSKFMQEFRNFAIKGNVVDMAVGIVVGGAFGKIVSSLVADVIMPAVGALSGGASFTDWKWVIKNAVMEGTEVIKPEVTINYGNFIQVIIDFIIIAFSIFLVIKGINSIRKKMEKPEEAPAPAPAPDPEPSEEVKLLQEIRDLLKKEQ